jgi:nucleoside-diphosphate-sugar epimerase
MTMPKILLTGATGSTGAVILEKLLEEGYSVNAVLRSVSKSKDTLVKQYASAVQKGQLEFVEIPDMAVSGAFDAAAASAFAIMHVATPLTSSDFEETMIKPGWAINENILSAATASSSVKRVIFTGSMISVFKLPDQMFSSQTFTEKDYSPVTLEEAKTDPTGRMGYQYSKVFAEKLTWDWVKKNQPKFDVIYLLPPAIVGRSINDSYVPDKDGLSGNSEVYRSYFDRDEPGMNVPWFLDVEDVAATHVKALSPTVEGNQRYLTLHPDLLIPGRTANFIREKFPQLQHRVPKGDSNAALPPTLSKFDRSKMEKAFGTNHKSWQESVADSVESIIQNEK